MGVAPFRLARLPGISPLRMLDYDPYVDDGGAGSAREGQCGYMSRVPRLTLVAPEFLEAVLDGAAGADSASRTC